MGDAIKVFINTLLERQDLDAIHRLDSNKLLPVIEAMASKNERFSILYVRHGKEIKKGSWNRCRPLRNRLLNLCRKTLMDFVGALRDSSSAATEILHLHKSLPGLFIFMTTRLLFAWLIRLLQ